MAEKAEQINEQTADIQEKIEVHGGEQFSNFDELEALQTKAGALETKTEGEPKAEETEEAKEEEPKGKEDPNRPDPTAEEDPGDEDEGEEDLPAAAKDEDASQDEGKPAKIFKVKDGESEIDLKADALIPVKVDGKVEQVSIQDVLENYSGKASLTRKFQEFQKEREDFDDDRKVIQGTLDEFHKLASEAQDPTAAIDFLGEIMGLDMRQYWDDVMGYLSAENEKLAGMTEDERAQYKIQRDNEFQAKQLERQKLEFEKERTRTSLESRLQQIQTNLEVSPSEYSEFYFEILENGKVPEEEITPELVGEYIEGARAYDQLENLIGEVNPELDNPHDAVEELQRVKQAYPEFGLEELKEYAVEVFGSQRTRNLSRKLKKSQPTDTNRVPKKQSVEAWDFDQI